LAVNKVSNLEAGVAVLKQPASRCHGTNHRRPVRTDVLSRLLWRTPVMGTYRYVSGRWAERLSMVQDSGGGSQLGAPEIHFVSRDPLLRDTVVRWARKVRVPVRRLASPHVVAGTTRGTILLVDLSWGEEAGLLAPDTDWPFARVILLVSPDRPVAPAWLRLAAFGITETVVAGRSEGVERYQELIAVLERELLHWQPRELTLGALELAPQLGPVADLIHLIAADRGGIRRPRDLARSARASLSVVKKRCRETGARRVEHFITLVRILLYELLTQSRHVAGNVALRLVGVRDRSNFSRQMVRSGYLRSAGGSL